MMTDVRIRPAAANEIDAVALVVATAFQPLDVCQWLVPEPSEQAAVFAEYFRIVTSHAVTHGTIDVVGDLSAVAVWLTEPSPEPGDYPNRLEVACGRWTPRFELLDTAFELAHPTGRGPHDYLAFLAVLPGCQHRGLGTALLRHRHAALAAQGRPAYLVASNSRSQALYARHGYVDCAPPLGLPYHGEQMRPMWRPVETRPPAA